MELKKTRDYSIDVLRWLALTGIILVHCKPLPFWSQLRSFDVPLMVMLSAVCYSMGGGGVVSYSDYLKKRFVRLVLPCWIFLTFYFIVSYIVNNNISLHKVILCYTLTTSWYLWIIRILIIMAFIAPLLRTISVNLSPRGIVIWSCLLLALSEILSILNTAYWYKMIVMLIPYTVYYMLGMNVDRFPVSCVKKSAYLFLVVYSIIALYLYRTFDEYVLTGAYKYPPRLYYTCYALGVSALLWIFRVQVMMFVQRFGLYSFAKFVGSHTFWIYLWHIPIVDFMVTKYDFIACFPVVYLSAILITYFQTLVAKKASNKINNTDYSKYIQKIFIG